MSPPEFVESAEAKFCMAKPYCQSKVVCDSYEHRYVEGSNDRMKPPVDAGSRLMRGDRALDMLTPRIISAFVFLFGSMAVCAAEPVPTEVEKLRWVLSADPVADAKKALERNDRTLMGVHGYTWTIPGVEESRKFEYRKKYGLKLIEGTGDVVLNTEHEDLIKKATEYARKYNLYLLQHKSEN